MSLGARFAGRRALVTGAGQGIGRRIAERFAEEGAHVILADRAPHAAEVARSLGHGAGQGADFIQADLESWEGARGLVARAEALGGIDILVNNVGGTIWAKPYHLYAPEEIEAEIRRSLFPTLFMCRAVLPAMLERGRGVVVNISSAVTALSTKRVPYAAAKGGVNAITSALSAEYSGLGLRFVGVAPGGIAAPPRIVQRYASEPDAQARRWHEEIYEEAIATSQMKRLGTLDEIAGVVLFAASDDASYITGTTIPVAGGHQG